MNPNSGRTWINFKELRASLRFEDVLRRYGVEVRRKGAQHSGPCPLPRHGDGRRAPTFSANLDRGIFQCFGCKAKGNLLEFAALMEGADPGSGSALREVAVRLKESLLPPKAAKEEPPHQAELPVEEVPTRAELPALGERGSAAVNAPLDFELKGLDPDHPYLVGRGFKRETMSRFGVGFCSRGLLKGRAAIPLHDPKGRLVGYAGRAVEQAEISKENPRYLFPEDRERNGATLRFDKGLLLYNAHRIEAPCDDLVVVEGFPSVWWLWQHGAPPAAAVMGTTCSEAQLGLIEGLVRPSGRVWIMPDGNEPGKRLALALLEGLSPRRFVRWVRLGEDRQPTDLSAAEIRSCLTA